MYSFCVSRRGIEDMDYIIINRNKRIIPVFFWQLLPLPWCVPENCTKVFAYQMIFPPVFTTAWRKGEFSRGKVDCVDLRTLWSLTSYKKLAFSDMVNVIFRNIYRVFPPSVTVFNHSDWPIFQEGRNTVIISSGFFKRRQILSDISEMKQLSINFGITLKWQNLTNKTAVRQRDII